MSDQGSRRKTYLIRVVYRLYSTGIGYLQYVNLHSSNDKICPSPEQHHRGLCGGVTNFISARAAAALRALARSTAVVIERKTPLQYSAVRYRSCAGCAAMVLPAMDGVTPE